MYTFFNIKPHHNLSSSIMYIYKLPSLQSKLWWYQFLSLALWLSGTGERESGVLDLWILRGGETSALLSPHCNDCNKGDGEGRGALGHQGRITWRKTRWNLNWLVYCNITYLGSERKSTLQWKFRAELKSALSTCPVILNKRTEIFSFKTNKCSILPMW